MKYLSAALTVAILAASTLSACGGNSDESEKNVRTLTVGALPIADYAPVFYAAEKGLFKKHGLDVKVEPIQGGANSVPALLNGHFSLAITNWTSYIQALSEDIPIRAVLPAAQAAPGYSGVVAAPDSGIKTPKDLVGKTIAVNNLKSVAELSARVGLKANGVDPDKVKFTELPLPDMPGALAKGSVDAVWVVEPFLTATKAQGGVVLFDPFAGQLDGSPIGGYSTSAKFAKANPKTLDDFAAAMAEATKALSDDTVFRKFLPSFTGLPPAVAAKLKLPTTQASLDGDSLDKMAALMKSYGWIDGNVDVKSSLSELRSAD